MTIRETGIARLRIVLGFLQRTPPAEWTGASNDRRQPGCILQRAAGKACPEHPYYPHGTLARTMQPSAIGEVLGLTPAESNRIAHLHDLKAVKELTKVIGALR